MAKAKTEERLRRSLEELTNAYEQYGSLAIIEVANAGRSKNTRGSYKRRQVQLLRSYLSKLGFSDPQVLGGLFLIKAPHINITPNIDFIVELPGYDGKIAKRVLSAIEQRPGDGINYPAIAEQFLSFKQERIPQKHWTTLLSPSREAEEEISVLWAEHYQVRTKRKSYNALLAQLKGAFLEEYAINILRKAQREVAPYEETVWVQNPWVAKPERVLDNKDRALYREGDIIIGIPHQAFYQMLDWIEKEHPATIQSCPVMRKRAMTRAESRISTVLEYQ
jgi:hypothetical protein